VTFEELAVTTNVEEYGCVLADDMVRIEFSQIPERADVESALTLASDGKTVEPVLEWSTSVLSVKPYAGWKKGVKYSLKLDSTVRMADGRSYPVKLERYFYRSKPGDALTIFSFSPANDAPVKTGDVLELRFNKPVDINSFGELFSIKPQCTTRTVFAEGNATVRIEPVDGWKANTVYEWSVKDLLAADGNRLDVPFDSFFHSPVDTAFPAVALVCPASPSGTGGYTLLRDTALDGTLVDDGPIAIVFSKPMEHSSALSSLSIDPAIKGYFTHDVAAPELVFFQPLESWVVGTRYTLTVASSVKDTSCLGLADERKFFFTPANRYLAVSSITLDSDAPVTDFANWKTARDHTVLGNAITVRVAFGSAIEESARSAIVKSVKVESYFPSTAANPYLVSVSWNPGATEAVMTWKNFTVSTAGIDDYYLVTVAGGSGGMANGRGQYLEEDVCVLFRAR
jgi:hypothetical protein